MLPPTTKMTFGKFRGEYVENLPSAYLEWCLLNIEGHDDLLEEMQRQLDMRHGLGGTVRTYTK